MNHHARLTALLAQIDQQLAETEDIGNDLSLEMHDLFKLCNAREGLKLARDGFESMLNRDADVEP